MRSAYGRPHQPSPTPKTMERQTGETRGGAPRREPILPPEGAPRHPPRCLGAPAPLHLLLLCKFFPASPPSGRLRRMHAGLGNVSHFLPCGGLGSFPQPSQVPTSNVGEQPSPAQRVNIYCEHIITSPARLAFAFALVLILYNCLPTGPRFALSSLFSGR